MLGQLNKKKYIKRVLIAALFLASYSGVYATYVLCNLVPLISAEISHFHDHAGHENAGHHESDSHNHSSNNHGTHNHGDDHHKGSNSHSHSHGEAMDDCCNDQTIPFIDSLPKLSPKQFHIDFDGGHVSTTGSYLVLNAPSFDFYPKLVRYIHPPPKVPDIRIFIQSFII